MANAELLLHLGKGDKDMTDLEREKILEALNYKDEKW